MAASRLSVVFLLSATGALAAPGERGALRTFKHWRVGCDNVRSCTAAAADRGEDGTGLALSLSRSGERNAAPAILIAPHMFVDLLETGTVTLQGGGGPVTLRIGRDAVLREGSLAIVSENGRAAVLAALRGAPELRVSFSPPLKDTARSRFTIPLDGATAALLWMDERQHRPGTPTALIRPGTRPVPQIPEPPPLPPQPTPVVPTGEPAPKELPAEVLVKLDALRAEGCLDDIRAIEPTPQPRIVRLGPGKLFVSLVCWPGGSSVGATYFIVHEGADPKVERAIFPRHYEAPPDPDRSTADFVLFNADESLKDGTIDTMEGTSGDGFCGEKGSWAWTGERFEPVVVTTLQPCGGASVSIRLYGTKEGGPSVRE